MISFFVLVDGLVNDVLRKQVVAVRIGLKPVADELLVERGLTVAGLIAFQGPEAAAVGSEHLVAEHYFAIFIKTELKLGVGNDDASGQSVVSAFLVKSDGAVADRLRIFLSAAGERLLQNLDASLEADVLVVVSDLSLGAGSVDGLRELVTFLEAFRELNAAYCAVLLVAGPAAAGDIAADDALDGALLLAQMFIPLLIFFAVLFFVAQIVGRLQKFPKKDIVALNMTTLARNSPLSLAIAVVTFLEQPLVSLALVIGPLIELPVLSVISGILKRWNQE